MDTRSIRARHASRDSFAGSNSSSCIRRSPVGVAVPELAPDSDPTPALGVPGVTNASSAGGLPARAATGARTPRS
eukprot:10849885-Alexandrium_andersonii.AAC.1